MNAKIIQLQKLKRNINVCLDNRIVLSILLSIIELLFPITKRVSKHQYQHQLQINNYKSIIMQSTFDIKFSNVRFRNQTIKQAKTRKNLNKKHQIAQLKIQNQLNSKHNSIRFKLVIFQNRFFFKQKVDIFIQKQFVVRHYLFQYIIDEKYVKCNH